MVLKSGGGRAAAARQLVSLLEGEHASVCRRRAVLASIQLHGAQNLLVGIDDGAKVLETNVIVCHAFPEESKLAPHNVKKLMSLIGDVSASNATS